jgi:RimJ/RimL family protein N-acetyltransferase
VLDYARDVLKLERVAAIVTPANRDSIKVLERIGLTFVRPMTLPNNDQVYLYLAHIAPQSRTTSTAL